MSTTILKKKADAIFSTYIRLKYADENLDVQCFTCDKVLPYKKIQNGHFYSRGILSLDTMNKIADHNATVVILLKKAIILNIIKDWKKK
jgi:hypothetical protein